MLIQHGTIVFPHSWSSGTLFHSALVWALCSFFLLSHSLSLCLSQDKIRVSNRFCSRVFAGRTGCVNLTTWRCASRISATRASSSTWRTLTARATTRTLCWGCGRRWWRHSWRHAAFPPKSCCAATPSRIVTSHMVTSSRLSQSAGASPCNFSQSTKKTSFALFVWKHSVQHRFLGNWRILF